MWMGYYIYSLFSLSVSVHACKLAAFAWYCGCCYYLPLHWINAVSSFALRMQILICQHAHCTHTHTNQIESLSLALFLSLNAMLNPEINVSNALAHFMRNIKLKWKNTAIFAVEMFKKKRNFGWLIFLVFVLLLAYRKINVNSIFRSSFSLTLLFRCHLNDFAHREKCAYKTTKLKLKKKCVEKKYIHKCETGREKRGRSERAGRKNKKKKNWKRCGGARQQKLRYY